MIDSPRSTSSNTVGRCGRKNSVCHRTVSSPNRRRSSARRSRGSRSLRSYSCSECRMRRSLARIDRRLASLGCAVNTSSIARRFEAPFAPSRPSNFSFLSCAMAAPSDSESGAGSRCCSRDRSTRTRCRSSAMLVRSKKMLNARATTRADAFVDGRDFFCEFLFRLRRSAATLQRQPANLFDEFEARVPAKSLMTRPSISPNSRHVAVKEIVTALIIATHRLDPRSPPVFSRVAVNGASEQDGPQAACKSGVCST